VCVCVSNYKDVKCVHMNLRGAGRGLNDGFQGV